MFEQVGSQKYYDGNASVPLAKQLSRSEEIA